MVSFRISINCLWPGEKLAHGDVRWGRYTRAFQSETHSIDSLILEIEKGYSFCPVMKGGHRKRANFVSAQHIGLDDDRGVPESSIDVLAWDPFIASHAAFLYQTISSTPECPRSRTVFILAQAITDPVRYRLACRALAWRFGDTDQSVAEESRFFYGALNTRVAKLGNVLSLETLQFEVIDPFQDFLREQASGHSKDLPHNARSLVTGFSDAERYVNRAVQEEVAWLSTRLEGTGERHLGLLVSSTKLASLRLSLWLPTRVRESINPYSILLPAVRANGYIAKYGEEEALRTIADGVSYATPRPRPEDWDPDRGAVRNHCNPLVYHPRRKKGHRTLPTTGVPL
jgi:predicted nucleic acid-binding protein